MILIEALSSSVEPPPRIAEAKIESTFQEWRLSHADSYIPTHDEDVAHMKQFGVARDKVRGLIKKFGGRKRGQKNGR